MKAYDRSTIREEPIKVQSKPSAPIVDADEQQKHRFSLRSER